METQNVKCCNDTFNCSGKGEKHWCETGLSPGEYNIVGGRSDMMGYWKARAEQAEEKLKALELVILCANDIVKAWPSMTIRLIGAMTNRVDTLRQALEAVENKLIN